jgi:hypothetical protein
VTAITLNLLAEEQLAQEANARDPLKTAIAICTGLLTLVVATGSVLYVLAGKKQTEAALLEARWNALAAGQAANGAADFKNQKSFADDLVAINRMRPTYAHQMALLKDLLPDSIRLEHISFAMAVQAHDAGAEDEDGKRLSAPKNAAHVSLVFEGTAVSSRPEIEVDSFLDTLRNNPDFKAGVKQIQLRSIARQGGTPGGEGASVPSAQFVIECQYKELN